MKIIKLIFPILFIIFLNNNLFPDSLKGLKIIEKKGNEGKRWAICIGINDYDDNKIFPLKKARNDAKLLGKIFSKQGQFDYVFVMTDDLNYKDELFPSKYKIEEKVNSILEFAKPDDLIVFSFSGHGISDAKGNNYLISIDTRINDSFNTSVKLDDIVKKFNSKGIKKTLLIIDACREELLETKGLNQNSLHAKLYQEAEIAATFYATKEGWYSYEDAKSDNGVFTYFIAQGLKGNADYNNDNIISFSELEQYVQDKVSDWAVKNGKNQKPYTKIYGEKFGDLGLTIKLAKEDVEKENINPSDVNKIKYKFDFEGKKNFFDLCFVGGPNIYTYDYSDALKNKPNIYKNGGLIGISFGYMFAFTKFFAFGPGATGFVAMNYVPEINGGQDYMLSPKCSGGAIMAQFMMGDLADKKTAFLLDLGGGWLFAGKIGIYVKGFVFKVGYHNTYLLFGNNVTIDFGYMFNWGKI